MHRHWHLFSALIVCALVPVTSAQKVYAQQDSSAAQQDSAAAQLDPAAAPGSDDALARAHADSALHETTRRMESVGPAADRALRICADPDNMPFSNADRAGFENKIAALIAKDLGRDSVTYTWWPHRRGFVRNTLRAKQCDLLVGAPAGWDPVAVTDPYYRSTYYIVTRAADSLNIKSLDDPALKELKIGINMIGEDYTNTPPAHALGERGITRNVVGFSTYYTATERPGDIIRAVAKGDIDVGIVWGPIAGYFAKNSPVPLTLVALPDSDRTGFPMAYDIAFGTRRADKEFREELNEVLARRRPEIQKILTDYNVPTVEGASTSKAVEPR